MLEVARLKSEYQRERLTSLRQQGFTEEQALEIIKSGAYALRPILNIRGT